MRASRDLLSVLLAAFALLFSAGWGLAEEQQEPFVHKTVPDSFTLQGTPGLPDGKMRLEHAEIVKEEDGTLTVKVQRQSYAHLFLRYRSGRFNITDIEDAYRDNQNPYKMPTLLLLGTAEPGEVEKFMGEGLRRELVEERKVVDGKFVLPMLFLAIRFEKRGEEFVVTNWLPEFLLIKKVLMRQPF